MISPPRQNRSPNARAAARLAVLTLFAALVAMPGVAASPAAAAEPCWKRLVADWYADGRVDKVYPVRCYRDAMKNLPEDAELYSSARDDINEALLAAIRSGAGPNDPVPPGAGGGEDPTPAGGTAGKGNNDPAARTRSADAPGPNGPIDRLFDFFRPTNVDSVPIPLLVLSGLALLLLAAAAAGFITRRVQERRVRIAPAPGNGRRR